MTDVKFTRTDKGFLHTPTKTEIMEGHWLEYLQFIKDRQIDTDVNPLTEPNFWDWYVIFKLEPTDASA